MQPWKEFGLVIRQRINSSITFSAAIQFHICICLFQPYRGGNQENFEERDRSVPTVTFELDTSPQGSQNKAVAESQSEQNMAQSKPPGVSMLSTLNF